jgi:hypothetical protein
MADCFISYSSRDRKFAETICGFISGDGLDVFMADLSLRPGDDWASEVLQTLRETEWVLFLASKAACESAYVQQEIGGAILTDKKLIPIVWNMSPSELPGWVNKTQALDIRGLKIPEVKEKVLEIAKRIKGKPYYGIVIALGIIAALMWVGVKSGK